MRGTPEPLGKADNLCTAYASGPLTSQGIAAMARYGVDADDANGDEILVEPVSHETVIQAREGQVSAERWQRPVGRAGPVARHTNAAPAAVGHMSEVMAGHLRRRRNINFRNLPGSLVGVGCANGIATVIINDIWWSNGKVVRSTRLG